MSWQRIVHGAHRLLRRSSLVIRHVLARRRPLPATAPLPARSTRRGNWMLLVASLLLGALTITSCTSCTGMPFGGKTNPPPVKTQGVPTVRVKLGQAVRTARISTVGSYRLLADNRVVHSGHNLPLTSFTYSGGRWTTSGGGLPSSIAAGNLFIDCGNDGLVRYVPSDGTRQLGDTQYRGDLHLLPQAGDTFLAINHVDMESYIAGVLPRELFPGWKYETYRALGVAARTFAYYHLRQAAGSGRAFDVGDNESSQMYGGYTAECTRLREDFTSRQAVDSTRGKVLVHRGQVMMSQYSSCCGGHVNPAYVLRADAPTDGPFAGGQVCRDCMASTRFNWGPAYVSTRELLAALRARYASANSLSAITDIRVKTQTSWGRPVMVDIVGPGGVVTVRADDLRLAWNMYNGGSSQPDYLFSMNCQWRVQGGTVTFYNGHGYGHGVGLCQYGAEGKAKMGWKAEQILSAYYPGAGLRSDWK